MLLTKQKNRKQIDSLKMDLEIINPIESKKVLGGDWYNDPDPKGYDWMQPVYVYYDYGGWWDNNLPDNYNDPGSWGGGDYTGGSPDGSPDPTFPDHICVQLDNGTTCAPMSLSYVANYYGATGLTSSDFAEMAGKNYNSMLMGFEEGLDNNQIQHIMSTVFQSTQINTYADIASNANNGIPILATIDQGSGIGHEVVITGLNMSNGDITYMDSMSGAREVRNLFNSANPISFIGSMYAVTGVQNNATVNQYKNDTNDTKCGICGH